MPSSSKLGWKLLWMFLKGPRRNSLLGTEQCVFPRSPKLSVDTVDREISGLVHSQILVLSDDRSIVLNDARFLFCLGQ